MLILVQGQLGDCWFLSALAVLGAHENLLKSCFWKGDKGGEIIFREYGMYVLRFFKDCNVIVVVVDDRIPVKAKDKRVIFAYSKDCDELWVPIIEKAYAKLHGSYKALIGGYTHFGLADMTGYCPRLIVLKEGFTGYSEEYDDQELWNMLVTYRKWGTLMGCSIQPNPKEKSKPEADAGNGLYLGHAYSLLDLGEIEVKEKKKVKLLKIRNPWGRGEWEGPYGDDSEERKQDIVNQQIKKVFFTDRLEEAKRKKLDFNEHDGEEVDTNDGTFFISFEDWRKRFTSLFLAMKFPDGSDPNEKAWFGKRYQGFWTAENGGNREMGTWLSNPKIELKFNCNKEEKKKYRQIFVGIYCKDSRLTLGGDYYKV